MNRIKAKEIISIYKGESFKVGNSVLTFARSEEEDIERIENLTDEELLERYKSMVWLNYIYGQVSVRDLQTIDLFELELSHRNIGQDLEEWYKKSQEEFNESDL
jgi:hypothetical protein